MVTTAAPQTEEEKELTLYDQEEQAQSERVSHEHETAAASKPELPALETEDEKELRSLIYSTSDVIEERVRVPEWVIPDPKTGEPRVVEVLIRGLNAYERAQFIQAMGKVNFDLTKVYPDLCILTVRHLKTKRLLWAAADRGELNKKMGRAIERLAMRSAEISALTEEALKDLKKK